MPGEHGLRCTGRRAPLVSQRPPSSRRGSSRRWFPRRCWQRLETRLWRLHPEVRRAHAARLRCAHDYRTHAYASLRGLVARPARAQGIRPFEQRSHTPHSPPPRGIYAARPSAHGTTMREDERVSLQSSRTQARSPLQTCSFYTLCSTRAQPNESRRRNMITQNAMRLIR